MADLVHSAADLRDYERAKFELADLLQAVVAARIIDKTPLLRERLQDLLARLAEDRFNLVVCGRFSRGKSSLMNAVLGMDRLPTGIVPLTSVITTVSYGSAEQVTLKYRERRLDTRIAMDELPDYVTQQGNPGNRLGIAAAEIELPSDILRRGFFFVDTPGLGSVIAENTLTTKAYLPEADALLLVTGFESPLSEEELDFFDAAVRSELPVFVAINKQDLATPAEREQVIAFVRSRLSELHGQSPQEVFPLSAREGLAGKLGNDAEQLRDSGVPGLEDRLVRFLVDRKRSVFLARMRSRIADLLERLPSFDMLPALRQRVEDFSARSQPEIGVDGGSISARPETPAFHRSLLRSCEICAAVEARTEDFLARYQYDLSIDRDCQTDFAGRSGFCCYHVTEYEQMASSFGICSGYSPLLERLATSLRAATRGEAAEMRVAIHALLPTHDNCPLCAARDEAESVAVRDVVDRLRGGGQGLEKLSALCLPHLAATADALDDPEIVRRLVEQQALALERTAEDMHRFMLKHSAMRRQLESREEETAATRGLALLAGRCNANFAVGQTTGQAGSGCDPAPATREQQDRT